MPATPEPANPGTHTTLRAPAAAAAAAAAATYPPAPPWLARRPRQANLRGIVAKARSAGAPRVLLVTPPPVWEPGRKAHQIFVSQQR